MARACSTPVLYYLVTSQYYGGALALLTVAGLTDAVDGFIARRFPNQSSAIGSTIDPLADKLLITTLVVSMTKVDLLPYWLTVLIIGRDVGLVGCAVSYRWYSMQPPRNMTGFFNPRLAVSIEPTTYSKVNTGVQLACITLSLAAPIFAYTDDTVLQGIWYVTSFTTVTSGLGYLFTKDAIATARKMMMQQ